MIVLLFLDGIMAKASAQADCDTVYNLPEIMPQFGNSELDILNYVAEELAPVFRECYALDSSYISSLKVRLTLDKNGKVQEVRFIRLKSSDSCEALIREKLFSMEGWTPGKVNGEPVCSRIVVPISCIKWD